MQLNKYIKSERGVTPTSTMLSIAVGLALILLVIVAGKPFLYSVFFNKDVQKITKDCLNKDDAIYIKKLKNAAANNSFILHERDVIIERAFDNEYLSVKLKYSYELSLPFYKRTLRFSTSTKQLREDQYKRGSSGSVKEQQQKTKGFLKKLKELVGIL